MLALLTHFEMSSALWSYLILNGLRSSVDGGAGVVDGGLLSDTWDAFDDWDLLEGTSETAWSETSFPLLLKSSGGINLFLLSSGL